MYLVKFNLIAIIIMMAIFSCSPLKQVTTMPQQIYYTQEGKPYILKCATLLADNGQVIGAGSVTPFIQFVQNVPPTPLPPAVGMYIQADKAVAPLMLYYNVMELGGGPSIPTNVATPYSARFLNGGNYDATFIKTISKIIALADLRYRDAVNPNSAVEYSLRYNQIVLSDDDFIDVNQNSTFVYGCIMGHSFKVGNAGITVPACLNGRVSISVMYFQFL